MNVRCSGTLILTNHSLLLLCLLIVSAKDVPESKIPKIPRIRNEQIQRHCGNPFFTSAAEENKPADSLIIGGTRAAAGTYHWAVALVYEKGDAFCGGTLISHMHVLTARHCITGIACLEKSKGGKPLNWWVQVGGVCTRQPLFGTLCAKVDMKRHKVASAIYPGLPGADICDYGLSIQDPVAHHVSDVAIITLEHQVLPLPYENGEGKEVNQNAKVGCLSQQKVLPCELHLTGWGATRRDFKADGRNRDSEPSAHLMEVKIPVVDPKVRPYKGSEICDSEKVVCTRDDQEIAHDAGEGDSGMGVVGYHGDRPFVDAMQIGGSKQAQEQVGFHIRTYSLLHEICFYTGICHRKEWAEDSKKAIYDDFLIFDQVYEYKGKSPPP